MRASNLILRPCGPNDLHGYFTCPAGLDPEDAREQCHTAAALLAAMNRRAGLIAFCEMTIFNPTED